MTDLVHNILLEIVTNFFLNYYLPNVFLIEANNYNRVKFDYDEMLYTTV